MLPAPARCHGPRARQIGQYGCSADARPARRAHLAGRVPAGRRALRPDRGDRLVVVPPRDPDARRGAHAADRLVFEVDISGRSTGDPELLELIERDARPHGSRRAADLRDQGDEAVGTSRRAGVRGRLDELGCRFALDVRGRLRLLLYLERLPFDYLKIDGEFVRRCPPTGRTSVIQAVVDIARGLGRRRSQRWSATRRRWSCWPGSASTTRGLPHRRPAPLAKWLVEEKRKSSGPPAAR